MHMDSERILRRLTAALTPSRAQQDRVRSRLLLRIEAAPAVERAKELSAPTWASRERVWRRVLERIEPQEASSLLERVRSLLTPSGADRALGGGMFLSSLALRPMPSRSQRMLQWAAAALVIVLLVPLTPLLFLAAPRSSAESAVLVVPTKGTLAIALRGLWEPTGEIQLKQGGARFRTEGGEATFSFNDDGNVRIQDAEVIVHDVTDRPEPALSGPTMTVSRGRVWVQGFVPEHVRGITISTPQGDVTVHEGSVSIEVGDTVAIHVWDRHARVVRPDGRSIHLVAGERMELWDGNVPLVKKIAAREYDEVWVMQNLAKDAVHRREIAQLQRERIAARAGILPTSPLAYRLKRAAETVDVFLTFDDQQRVEKQLQQASTRLDEAAAILASGGTGATAEAALEEYRSTLLSVASGSGGDSIAQFLIRQQVAEDSAQVAATLPDDTLYVVKKTVLQASADLPAPVVDARNVEGVLFLDSLSAVQEALHSGDIAHAKETFDQTQAYLEMLQADDGTIAPEVRKEAISLLSAVAQSLEEQADITGTPVETKEFLEQVALYLPLPAPLRTVMTPEDAATIAQGIFDRVFIFKQPHSRWSQLMYEMKQLQGHSDEGTILRQLYRLMPEQGLGGLVRTAIVELGKERAER